MQINVNLFFHHPLDQLEIFPLFFYWTGIAVPVRTCVITNLTVIFFLSVFFIRVFLFIGKRFFQSSTHWSLIFFLTSSSSPKKPTSFWADVIQYFEIWSFFQWTTSLVTLIFGYWATGYLYNKILSKKGGWMDAKTRIIMIIVDLILNFIFGIYFMGHRDTVIGQLVLHCPVFFSPFFWIVELICFYLYSRYNFSLKKKKK